MDLYQSEAACHSPLEQQYHSEVRALLRSKGRRNKRVFTYTDHDRYTGLQQQVGLHRHAHVGTTHAPHTHTAMSHEDMRKFNFFMCEDK